MRVHDEQTPHASWSFGVRQFNARATSSAKRFLPIPSSPVNSNAPGSRSATIIRLSAALTRSFPVNSSNIIHREVPAALQKRNDDFPDTFLCLLDWTTRIDHFHSLGFGQRDLQISIAHARVKVGFLDVEPVARDLARRSAGGTPCCA